ncbi:MAG: hypothetical protein JO020_20410 [Chloroflexi bacterium]|nr:hypothetical protein [Chloroflexota bacterium]MBV9135237.1 hypothetical protein [Chloroflexota bacterium]MBV9896537.1 hypothetical protein [Chloroflexota bacterium]
MMSPQAFEQLVRGRQEELWQEAAHARRVAEAQLQTPGVRRRLAGSLYRLAAWLSAGVAEARGGADGIRTVADCCGVEYWRPTAVPLRR